MTADTMDGAAPPSGTPDCFASVDRRVFTYYARLARVERYVRDHLCEPIRLQDAAEIACVAPPRCPASRNALLPSLSSLRY
jgi:hypothetical protein